MEFSGLMEASLQHGDLELIWQHLNNPLKHVLVDVYVKCLFVKTQILVFKRQKFLKNVNICNTNVCLMMQSNKFQ